MLQLYRFGKPAKRSSLELSSSQFIIKLLYKELNDVTAKHAPASDAVSESGGREDLAARISWSEVTSKYSYNTHRSRNFEVLQKLQPVSITNGYSVLANLPESTAGEHEAVPLENEKSTQPSFNYYMRKKDQWRTTNPNQSSSQDSCALTTFSHPPRSWKGISEQLQK
jgi:hypothetical protein